MSRHPKFIKNKMRNNLTEKGELMQWQIQRNMAGMYKIDGVQYLVEYMKGSIFINGGEAFKLRSLERTGTLRKDKQLSYTVPLAGKELNLVISAVSGISLIMDGMDLGTYPDGAGANQKAPAWIVVFYVLYFIEYWGIMGGAIGGLLLGTAAVVTFMVAKSEKLSTGVKLVICIALYVVATALELVIRSALVGVSGRYR